MSNISSGFIPTGGTTDTLKDFESYQYSVEQGNPTNLGAITPTNLANSLQVVNCSPCPLKGTITVQPPSTDKGGALPAVEVKEVVIKANEVFSISFEGVGSIVDFTPEEAAAAPADAITPDVGSAVVAAATQDLNAAIRFLNC